MSEDQSTWLLNQIPKRMSFYWGARKMTFLRLMSLYSFVRKNPDWHTVLYMPTQANHHIGWAGKQYENEPGDFKDYTCVLHRIGVEIKHFDFRDIGLNNQMNEVHKSDYLRYHLLFNSGGAWADMDVLFMKPMNDLKINKAENAHFNAFCFWGDQPGAIPGHAIGFLLGAPNNNYYKDVYHWARRGYKPQEYQCLGADMLNTRFQPHHIKRVYPLTGFLDKEAVYSIDHNYRDYLYEKDGMDMLGPNAVGLHWYGGSEYVKNLLFTVNHENYLQYPNEGTLLKLLKKEYPDGVEL
jgi:hypothetical protein